MRIVVSGTHASGKSTLISDFAALHPEFTVLADPFELVDEASDSPNAAMFAAQLRLAADRLVSAEFGGSIIAERGPLDFLAYVVALEELGEVAVSRESVLRMSAVAAEANRQVDLIVVLPLTASDGIVPGLDEHLELRDAMNDVLLELIDDSDLVGDRARVVEIVGDRGARLARLESLVARR